MAKRNYYTNPLKIFIAVGHGGPDPGAVHGSYRESDVNLAVAMLMQQDLRRHGVEVRLSRSGDETDRLRQEIDECNAFRPDFAVAIHTNASYDGKASGFEVYHQPVSWKKGHTSQQVAQRMNDNVQRYLHVRTRGLKRNSDLAWLQQVEAPCVLCENFFINGPKAAWYMQPAQLEVLSKAYTRAVLEQYGILYRSAESFALRYALLREDAVERCQCSAVLIDGSHYVHLREFAGQTGWAVHYDEANGVQVYAPQCYAPSQYSGKLQKQDGEQKQATLFETI